MCKTQKSNMPSFSKPALLRQVEPHRPQDQRCHHGGADARGHEQLVPNGDLELAFQNPQKLRIRAVREVYTVLRFREIRSELDVAPVGRRVCFRGLLK
jgi:hypothetical protein